MVLVTYRLVDPFSFATLQDPATFLHHGLQQKLNTFDMRTRFPQKETRHKSSSNIIVKILIKCGAGHHRYHTHDFIAGGKKLMTVIALTRAFVKARLMAM